MKTTRLASLHVLFLAALACAAGLPAGKAAAQTPVVHAAPRLAAPVGNLFYRTSADGSWILVNHSPNGQAEELVVVPRDGATEQLWLRSPGRGIYNRIAVSGDGKTVAYSRAPGSKVHVLDRAGGTPRSICDVAPDGDVRQLLLSHDGALAVFTASRFKDASGRLVRVRTNLYVARTDGTALTTITAAPVLEKFIPFALSGDGKTLVWADDPKQGAWVADAGGANAKRLPAAPGGRSIQAVFSNATGSVIYYQTAGGDGVKLQEIDRAEETVALRHEAAHGFYAVSADGARIHLCQAETAGKRAWSRVTAGGPVKVTSISWPRHLGSWAWSAGGGTLVYCGRTPAGGPATYVWRATQP